MKDVQRRANPFEWAAKGSLWGYAPLLGCCGCLLALVSGSGGGMAPGGDPGEQDLEWAQWLLLAPPLIGGVAGFVLAVLRNRHGPHEQGTRVPAAVEAAARERFGGSTHGEGGKDVRGPDERVQPDKGGITEV